MLDFIAIIVGFTCILSIVSIGNIVLKKLNGYSKSKSPWYEELSYSTGTGLILLSAWAFAVNFIGYGYWWTLILPLLFGIGLTLSKIEAILQTAKAIKKRVFFSNRFIKIASLLFAVLFLIATLIALAPPSINSPGPTDQDSLNYHLVIPKFYLSQHSLEQIPFLAYDNWPHSIETFYTIPMSLGGVSAVKLTMLFVSFAILLALFAFARRFVKTEHALLAPLIFASSPVIFLALGSAYVDIALSFFVVLSLMALHSWTIDKQRQHLLLAGAFAGFAASVKLSGTISLILVALAILALTLKGKPVRESATQWAWFGIPALVFASPWLLRTFLASGNPIYPLYSSFLTIFGIPFTNEVAYFMAKWNAGAIASGGGANLVNLLLLPWNLTMNGKLFNGIISPLFLAFAPLFLLSIWHKNTTSFEKLLIAFSFIFSGFWFITYQEARFYEPVLAIGAVLLAITISRFPSVQNICTKAAVAVMVAGIVIMFIYSLTAFPVALGFEEKENYLNRTLNTYQPCQFINENSEVKQVLFYKIEAAFYCNKPFAYTFSYDTDSARTKEELIEKLRNDGFTHTLVYSERTTGSMAEFTNSSQQPIYTSGALALYKIPV